jgi:hypothetical protein
MSNIVVILIFVIFIIMVILATIVLYSLFWGMYEVDVSQLKMVIAG